MTNKTTTAIIITPLEVVTSGLKELLLNLLLEGEVS